MLKSTKRQTCLYILATVINVVLAQNQFEQVMTGLQQLQQRNRGLDATVHLGRQRMDQSDPCNLLLEDVNVCLPSTNPTCGTCVTTAFDMFLSTITANFTCTDFKGGVCPIVFQECLCAPCNTELESYFNCVLNDASNNECPVAYCDPLKDFSITPEACLDDLAFASACIGTDCLECLSETIDSGAECDAFEGMVCDAVNIDCLSCLKCRNVVEPWLNCIAVESKSCTTFQCDASVSPATAPSSVLQPSSPTIIPPFLPTVPTPAAVVPTAPIPPTGATTSPTSTPQASIVDAPNNGDGPTTVNSPVVTVPNTNGPILPTISPMTTKEVPDTSMATITTLSNLCATALIGMWLCCAL